MSLYSKHAFHCNNCGQKLMIEWMKLLGRTYKVCSKECKDALEEKITKSILGEEDKPKEK